MSQIQMGPHGQTADFHSAQWADIGSYGTTQSPDFSAFSFMSSPMEPPSLTISTQQLQRNTEWSGASPRGTFRSPPILSTTPVRAKSLKSHQPARRTLSDDDRKRMCHYHEDNPGVKQTEIGNMFGVERSTVSKVLRQKEKYVNREDGSKSPVKRSKGKFPDIERALYNWAKNSYKAGQPVSDEAIREKAKFFAATVGGDDGTMKINGTWMEKFKQKSNLAGAKANRKSAIKHLKQLDSARQTPELPLSRTPSSLSHDSPNPTDKSMSEMYMPYYETSNGGPLSPTSPFYSPGHNSFLLAGQQPLSATAYSNRSRSQTFPSLGLDGFPTTTTPPLTKTEPLTQSLAEDPAVAGIDALPRLAPAPSSTASPMMPPPIPLDTTTPHQHLYHSQVVSPSPTREDARQALEVLLHFLQHQQPRPGNNDDCLVLSKLMERLGPRQQFQPGFPASNGGVSGLGCGLSSMADMDGEVGLI